MNKAQVFTPQKRERKLENLGRNYLTLTYFKILCQLNKSLSCGLVVVLSLAPEGGGN